MVGLELCETGIRCESVGKFSPLASCSLSPSLTGEASWRQSPTDSRCCPCPRQGCRGDYTWYTLYTAHCTQNTTLHTTHYTLHTTLHATRYTLHATRYTLYTIHYRSRSLPRHYTTRLSGSSLDLSGAKYDFRKDTLYVSKSISVICSQPYVRTSSQVSLIFPGQGDIRVLQVLHSIHKYVSRADYDIHVLESFIYNLLYDIPLPSPGRFTSIFGRNVFVTSFTIAEKRKLGVFWNCGETLIEKVNSVDSTYLCTLNFSWK